GADRRHVDHDRPEELRRQGYPSRHEHGQDDRRCLRAGTVADEGSGGREPAMTAGGFSKARRDRLHDVMAGHVERGEVPGPVTLVSRRGEAHVDVIGRKALAGEPMRRATIFRIASITKPIASAAAMILVAESKLRLYGPV